MVTRDGVATVGNLRNAGARAVERREMTSGEAVGREILECVLVLGPDATIGRVAAVLGLDPAHVRSAVADLAATRSLHHDGDRLELTRPQAPAVDLKTAQRLHRRAAIVLHDDAAPADAVTAQLLRADAVNADWVTAVLRAEARRRERAGDHAIAVALFERALDERLDDDTRGKVLIDLASIDVRLNPLRAADRYREALTMLDEPNARFAAALGRSRCLVLAGMVTEGVEQLDAIKSEIDDPNLVLQAELAYVAEARHSLETRPLGRARLDRISELLSRRTGDVPLQLLGELAYERVLSGGDLQSAVAAAMAALGGDDLSRLHELPAPTRHVVLLTLCWAGELDEAERAAKLVLARAQRRGALIEATEANVILFNVEWRRGDLERTLAHTDRVIAASSEGVVSLLPAASGYKAMALAVLGRSAEALAALELPGDERRWSALAGFHGYLDAAAWAYLEVGEFQRARLVALRCGALASSMGTDNPAVLSWRAAAAHAGVALGLMDEASDLALDAVERARAFGAPQPIARALRALAAAHEDNALDLLQEAATLVARSPDQLLRARIDFDLARALWSEGKPDAARERARAASELAHGIGACPLEADARRFEASVSERPRPQTPPTARRGHLRVLGDFSLTDANGQVRTPPGVPGRALRILAAAGEPIHIEQLAEALWDEPLSPEQARSRLRNVMARTRLKGQPVVQRDGNVVYLDPAVSVDAAQFEQACVRALAAPDDEQLEASVAATLAYGGDLLPTDPYAEWAAVPRERLRLRYLTMCDRVARLASAAGLHDLAVDRLQAAIRHDPYDTNRYATAAAILRTIGDAAGAEAMSERERRVRLELDL